MANLRLRPTKTLRTAVTQTNFRYLSNIDSLETEALEEQGYYRGFQCPHNHFIRDIENHWCYHCVEKILSNNCGFNINFMHEDYKVKLLQLWKRVEPAGWSDCWTAETYNSKNLGRVCFPSYRSFYSNQKSKNISFHKAIYQCAWGDVGNLTVTRWCGTKDCVNPLHLVSSWNRKTPPASITPFVTEFDAAQLMLFGQTRLRDDIQTLIRKDMKATIAHPLDVAENPEYNE